MLQHDLSHYPSTVFPLILGHWPSLSRDIHSWVLQADDNWVCTLGYHSLPQVPFSPRLHSLVGVVSYEKHPHLSTYVSPLKGSTLFKETEPTLFCPVNHHSTILASPSRDQHSFSTKVKLLGGTSWYGLLLPDRFRYIFPSNSITKLYMCVCA